jgi:hypothetical protein
LAATPSNGRVLRRWRCLTPSSISIRAKRERG